VARAPVRETVEGVLVGPLRDDHRGRNEDPWRVLVGRKHCHRLARLDDQCLVGAEGLEGGNDVGQVFLGARCLASTSVDDERVGILGDAGVEVVEEAAEHAFLLPAAAAQGAQAAMPGKSTRKEAPPPGLSSTQARPPCSAANCATSERPTPTPVASTALPRAKAWKIVSFSPSGTPGPWSSTRRSAPVPSGANGTSIGGPAGVRR